eukprot:586091-Pelagomonas_calceolata.AAC.1
MGKEKKDWAEKTFPTSVKEKEKHWLRRAVNSLNREAYKELLMGICQIQWRVTGSTRVYMVEGTRSSPEPMRLLFLN